MQEAFDNKLFYPLGRPLVTPIGKCSSFYRVGDDQFLFQAGHRSLIITREELLDLNPDRKVYLENISPILIIIEKDRGTAKKVASEEDRMWLEAYLEYQEFLRQERYAERALEQQRQEEWIRWQEMAWAEYLAEKAADERAREERQAQLAAEKERIQKIINAPAVPEKTEEELKAIRQELRDRIEEREKDLPFWMDPTKQWAD